MGGESIKPIRKRIHVYFLMTTYIPEFKDEAVKLITERGYSVTDVAERLGVSQHSIYKWL